MPRREYLTPAEEWALGQGKGDGERPISRPAGKISAVFSLEEPQAEALSSPSLKMFFHLTLWLSLPFPNVSFTGGLA